MRSVGIKQLKARLSEYVRLARSGEVVLVTDRDEVVAELGPARRQQPEAGSLELVPERLAERGEVTRAAASKEDWSWSPPHLGLSPEVERELAAAEVLATSRLVVRTLDALHLATFTLARREIEGLRLPTSFADSRKTLIR